MALLRLSNSLRLLGAVVVCFCAAIAHGGTNYPPVPWTDNFGNFNATTDDNGTTFWKEIPGSLFSPNQVAEAGSNLVLVSDAVIGATLVGLDVSSTFNFFATPLNFAVSGIDLSASTAPATAQLFRFAVQDSGSVTAAGDATSPTASGANSAVVVDINGANHLALNLKEGNLTVNNPLLDVNLQGRPTAFTLTLDGTVATPTYSLLVNEGSGSETFTGTLPGLTQQNWGGLNERGWSAISLAGLNNGGGTGTLVNATVDAVMVSPVPEPSTFALVAFGGAAALMVVRRRS